MSSRLFRAVVGVGIALGTVSAACRGVVESTTDGSAGPTDPPGTVAPRNEAGTTANVDGGSGVNDAADAAGDAPKDVILDAFCDAAWPTTKGNPGGPTCGPVTECAEAGAAPRCYRVVTSSTFACDPQPPPEVAWCIRGHWECSGDGVPQEQCTCWAGQPCNDGGSSGSSNP